MLISKTMCSIKVVHRDNQTQKGGHYVHYYYDNNIYFDCLQTQNNPIFDKVVKLMNILYINT